MSVLAREKIIRASKAEHQRGFNNMITLGSPSNRVELHA